MRRALVAFSVLMVAGVLTGFLAWAQAPVPPATQAPPSAPAAPQRFGIVDVQRVLARSTAGVAAREELERDKAVMQKEIDGKRQELEKLRDELEKKGALMSADARKEKQDALDRKQRDAVRLADDFRRELQKKEQGHLQRVIQEVSGIIERVGKQRGYAVIVERGAGVLYAAADADVTDEVIRAYDQQGGTAGKKDQPSGTTGKKP